MTVKELLKKINWHISRSHASEAQGPLADERMFLRREYLKEVRAIVVQAQTGGVAFDDGPHTRTANGLQYPPRLRRES